MSQTGKVSGKVLNEKNEPVQGVSIKIEGVAKGSVTDIEGRYLLTLESGKQYSITFTSVGYDDKRVDEVAVTTGEVIDLPVILQVTSKNLGEVTVTGTRNTIRRETVNSIIQFQKNTNTVASVISAESIRRSPDRNTGEVLKRTPGASLVDGKFLVIRGLADRYNLAMLNGVPLSSTEPDRKTFSFDLIPAAMIDNIIINKAFVPEFPAEWAGGLIQVNTKDVPSQNFFNIQVGGGFNTQSIGNNFYSYKGGKYDFLGLDDGFRNLPSSYKNKSTFNDRETTVAQKSEVAKGLKNIWTGNKVSVPFNQQLQASGGFNTKIWSGKSLGGIFAITYNRQMRYTKNETNDNVINANQTYSFNSAFDDDRYSEEVLWGALGNLSLQLNANNKINIKTLFNVNGTKYITDRTGVEDFRAMVTLDSVRASELTFRENIFFNGQIGGDHNLLGRNLKFHWYGSFNALSGNQPDQRRILYSKANNGTNLPYEALISNTLSQRTGSRLFQNLSDYIYTAGGDLSQTFNLFGYKQTIKGGYLFQVKDRLFDAKFFSAYLEGDNPPLRALPPDRIFSPENFGNGSDGLFGFDMIKGENYRYVANTILNTGFIQFDNQFTEKLRAVWGVRVENYDQLVGSVKRSNQKFSNTEVRDFLPGVNLTYKLNSKTNIRASGSQTVVRPEFRELASFTYYDFDLNGTVTGSKFLTRTKVSNFDLRYEIYPRAGEVITLGVFYKYFKDPIIQRFNKISGNQFLYQNASNGYTFGPEFEFRKRLDFVSDRLSNFTFQANLAYIESNIEQFDRGRKIFDEAFQGQSNYLINASLLYDAPAPGVSATLLFNQIGRRIAFYGDLSNDQPPVWEAPRAVVDFQIAKKIIKGKGELKMNISDILNQRLYFYQNVSDKLEFDKSIDATRFSRKFGTSFSFTFGYSI